MARKRIYKKKQDPRIQLLVVVSALAWATYNKWIFPNFDFQSLITWLTTIGGGLFVIAVILAISLKIRASIRAGNNAKHQVNWSGTWLHRKPDRTTFKANHTTKSEGSPDLVISRNHEESLYRPATVPPTDWTLDLLAGIEWRVFEKLCSRLWCEKGFIAKETNAGADGGVDLYLYASNNRKIGAVQCKSWGKRQIGVSILRELQGVVTAEKLKLGILMYSGTLSDQAKTFLSNPAVSLKVMGDAEILADIKKLTPDQQKDLFQAIVHEDYQIPSCPNCDIKLVNRTAKNKGTTFWGCSNFPKCRHIQN